MNRRLSTQGGPNDKSECACFRMNHIWQLQKEVGRNVKHLLAARFAVVMEDEILAIAHDKCAAAITARRRARSAVACRIGSR